MFYEVVCRYTGCNQALYRLYTGLETQRLKLNFNVIFHCEQVNTMGVYSNLFGRGWGGHNN